MNQIYAVILNGVCINTVVLGPNDIPNPSWVNITGTEFGVEWAFNGTNWTAPVVAAPVAPPPITWEVEADGDSQSILSQFATSKQKFGFSPQQVSQMWAALGSIPVLLLMGNMQDALTLLPTVPVDGVMILSSDISNFTQSIQTYIQSNPVGASAQGQSAQKGPAPV